MNSSVTRIFTQSGISKGIQFFSDPTGKWDFGVSAADLADCLGILDPSFLPCSPEYVSLKSSPGVHTTLPFEGVPEIVWEPGVYESVTKAKSKWAKPFQSWLFEEVLPSIRKTGRYGAPVGPELSQLQQAIVEELEGNRQMQENVLDWLLTVKDTKKLRQICPRVNPPATLDLVRAEHKALSRETWRTDVYYREKLEEECLRQIQETGKIRTSLVHTNINFGASTTDKAERRSLDWVKDEIDRLLPYWDFDWKNRKSRIVAVHWTKSA